jgi:hypothetical protein
MPAVSQKQRAFIYATKGPAFAKAHHFDNPGKLPEKVHAQAGKTNVGLALFRAMQKQKKK